MDKQLVINKHEIYEYNKSYILYEKNKKHIIKLCESNVGLYKYAFYGFNSFKIFNLDKVFSTIPDTYINELLAIMLCTKTEHYFDYVEKYCHNYEELYDLCTTMYLLLEPNKVCTNNMTYIRDFMKKNKINIDKYDKKHNIETNVVYQLELSNSIHDPNTVIVMNDVLKILIHDNSVKSMTIKQLTDICFDIYVPDDKYYIRNDEFIDIFTDINDNAVWFKFGDFMHYVLDNYL